MRQGSAGGAATARRWVDATGQEHPDAKPAVAEQELEQELLLAERHAALREAFADLPPDCRRLLALPIEDPGGLRQSQC
jgi:DNA-directed RNA polymerase specialized sigma24 family protein